MKFSELMRRLAERGVAVEELRDGTTPLPTFWWDGLGAIDPEVTGVCDDSRKVKVGDLFVLRGEPKLEHTMFIGEAMNRGAVAIVSERTVGISGIGSGRVSDSNLACALMAHEVAGNPTAGMKMVAVTGTKGKTTVAYLLRAVLKAAGHVVGMVGTVEIDDGKSVVPAEMTTPGSVELVELFGRMRANGVTHCVMEVSSHALHQQRVAGIEWEVGIFTNLTGDHLDYHGTMEGYAAAKKILFDGLKEGATAVMNADDAWGERMVAGCKGRMVRYHVEMGTGKGGLPTAPRPDGGWSGLVVDMTSEGMAINMAGPDPLKQGILQPMYKMTTPLVGLHNAYNLTAVVAATWALGMPDASFMRGIRVLPTAPGAPGRLQRVETGGAGFSVFVDYAHTHDALANVLTAVRATMGPPKGGTPNTGRLICVFGCGGDRDRTKRPKMGKVAEELADRVIVTSDNPRTEEPGAIIAEIRAGFSPGANGKVTIEADRRNAIRAAIGEANSGDVVVIAGKGHENYQIVGTTKHHFDDVEEASAALAARGH